MHLVQIIKLLVASGSVVSLGITGCTQQHIVDVQAQERPPATSAASPTQVSDAGAAVRALVRLGPRVAGTPVMAKASTYLIEAYRQAGYVTQVQTFTYQKFTDLGSNLTMDGKTIAGQALNGSVAGKLTAPLVAVPKVGRAADFASVDVKGAIAIVQRGEIRFLDKARNAVAAGAIGLVVVNTDPGTVSGTLGGVVSIPVLTLAGEQGSPLLAQAQQVHQPVNLAVNTRQRTVTGRNIVAHLPQVKRPSLLLGGHYDSVAGSPGANDNASGTAVVLAIARTAAKTPLARQAWFVAFDGEEDGLHGSRAFVRTASPQFLKGLKGMLNFDMVGVNDKLSVGGSQPLAALAQAAAPEISTFGSHGGSDHAPFASAGVPVLFFHRGQEPNYHSPRDRSVEPKLLDATVQVGLNVTQRLLAAGANAGMDGNK